MYSDRKSSHPAHPSGSASTALRSRVKHTQAVGVKKFSFSIPPSHARSVHHAVRIHDYDFGKLQRALAGCRLEPPSEHNAPA